MKLKLIYYKNVLDLAIEEFVSCYESFFVKSDGKYVLGLSVSKDALQKALNACIDKCISSLSSSLCGKDDVLLVIGSCYPKDNMLLSFKDDGYFPKKLSSLIESQPDLKWILAEKDIEIGTSLFNELFVRIFNAYFCKPVPKKSSMKRQNVVFVSHSKLDCYMVFKTIKWAYGSSNCCNVWKEHFQGRRQNFIALNDLVSKYIHNKSRMNKSIEFKKCALEMKDFLDKKLMLEK